MTHNTEKLQLLTQDEAELRLQKITAIMRRDGVDAILINDNANLFYLTGRVFCGYALVAADGSTTYFVRRPIHLDGDDNVVYIRKPEEIAETAKKHLPTDAVIGLTGDDTSWSVVERLKAVFAPRPTVNASSIIRQARAIKTPHEIALLETSGLLQTQVYRRVPALYTEGMTDIELQIEIERALRLKGCLGIFRTSGDGLEIFMGNVLTGENADSPSPYDFAMGGRGLDASIPVGADGTLIRPDIPVMVDMNGNFNGYMTDMTRCYILGDIPDEVAEAHQLSCDICDAIARAALPGTPASDLYNLALGMARDAGLESAFMGHRQQAGFVGHGIGITVNELPVIAPRSKDILSAGNVIAVEPKFVIPKFGAIGIENTYVVQDNGPARLITNCPQQIMSLL